MMPQVNPPQPYPSAYPPVTPSYPSSNYHYNQDDNPGDPGIEEIIPNKKDAGAGSFAHYIVKFVSNEIFNYNNWLEIVAYNQ